MRKRGMSEPAPFRQLGLRCAHALLLLPPFVWPLRAVLIHSPLAFAPARLGTHASHSCLHSLRVCLDTLIVLGACSCEGVLSAAAWRRSLAGYSYLSSCVSHLLNSRSRGRHPPPRAPLLTCLSRARCFRRPLLLARASQPRPSPAPPASRCPHNAALRWAWPLVSPRYSFRRGSMPCDTGRSLASFDISVVSGVTNPHVLSRYLARGKRLHRLLAPAP
jgi:hypothetical protein